MNPAHPVIGIDGEGYTDARGRHRYTYIAACDGKRLVSELHRAKGIASHEVFSWLLALPKEATLVGFSLGYDLTKWVGDMRDGAVWVLMRPDERSGDHGPRAVKWRDFRVNKVGRRISVARNGESRVIWDVWAFFQGSFVSALSKWETAPPATIARIAKMKDKRSTFARIDRSERLYCQSECKLLARLVRQLLDAHAEAGLELHELYSAGSTAKVMLREMKAEEHNVKGSPAFMRAVDAAFAAGRFETSRVGPVPGPLYAYDLASAYPYAWCLLPCLKHGRWRKVGPAAMRRALARGGLALVRYRLQGDGKHHAWGPLPFRLGKPQPGVTAAQEGNLVWPAVSAGGWAWSPEVIAGRKLHGGIVVRGGYVFVPGCKCGHPFRAHMVRWYKARLQWGKKGKGRCLRLGLNSCTGKAMQRVGSNAYRCMVRAGLVTSYTRARLLEAIACARDPWSIVEVATDSVLSREPLSLPPPVALGTRAAAKRFASSELGAWDASPVNVDGAFICRPGQRFRLQCDAIEETASRGMPVKWLHANRARITRHWTEHPAEAVRLPPPTNKHGDTLRIFIGAKPAVRKHATRWTFVRSPNFGQWIVPEPRVLSFAAGPKRESLLPDFRMACWELPQGAAYESVGYSMAPESEHTRRLVEHQEQQEDQE